MPSSTSNSRDRVPESASLRIWLIGMLVGAVLLGGLEMFWRYMGHKPSVTADATLWSVQRAKLESDDRNNIALLGWSRSLYNMVPQEIISQQPQVTVANLAIEGKHPYATLRDLANNESFRGLVLCDITYDALKPKYREDQQFRVDEFHRKWQMSKGVERRLRSEVQSRLVLVSPRTSIKQFADGVFNDTWEWPFHMRIQHDRWWAADFHAANFDHIIQFTMKLRRNNAKEVPVDQSVNIEGAKLFGQLVTKIQQRGGEVVFVRMPIGRHPWERKTKSAGWHLLVEHTTAKTIHFSDYPELSKYILWDGSHIDMHDAPAFTRSVVAILVEMKVLPRPN